MTEREWLDCVDEWVMLESQIGRVSERKLRLFLIGCCRLIWDRFTIPAYCTAVEIAERYADESATVAKLQWVAAEISEAAANDAEQYPSPIDDMEADSATGELCPVRGPTPEERERYLPLRLVDFVTQEQVVVLPASIMRMSLTEPDMKRSQLLRHILGNPFRPYQPPPSWPSTVVTLAQSLYDQEPVHFALHDALLDCGHHELADHFKEPGHPKGCWALDTILGKS